MLRNFSWEKAAFVMPRGRFESDTELELYSVLLLVRSTDRVKRWRNRAKLWLIEWAGGKCQVCGYCRCSRNLSFHHTHDKKAVVSRMVVTTMAFSLILEEAKKCVLLCHNCHGEVHDGITSCPGVEPEARERRRESMGAMKTIAVRKERPCKVCSQPTKSKYCSLSCSGKRPKISWPPDEELSQAVLKEPLTSIALRLGVSDKAVKKHCKIRNIGTPGVGFWGRSRSVRCPQSAL